MWRLLFLAFISAIVIGVLGFGAAFIGHQKRLLGQNEMIRNASDFYKEGKYREAYDLIKSADAVAANERVLALKARILCKLSENPKDGLDAWTDLLEKHPESDYTPEALLAQAEYQRVEMNEPDNAKKIYLQILEKYPNSEPADRALLSLSRIAIKENNIEQTRRNLEALIQRPMSDAREQAEFLLGKMNMEALYSPDPDPMSSVYVIKQGDSLSKVSNLFHAPVDLISGINRIENIRALRVGQRLKIPKLENLAAVVDLEKRAISLYCNQVFLQRYRIGIGLGKRVPIGNYTVQSKSIAKDDKKAAAAGTAIDPINQPGAKRINLNKNAVYIHQAYSPELIGKQSDSSVIAVSQSDLDELYSMLNKGIPVVIMASTQDKKVEEKKK